MFQDAEAKGIPFWTSAACDNFATLRLTTEKFSDAKRIDRFEDELANLENPS